MVAVDNFITGSLANIAHLNDHPNFTLVEQDVNEPFLINGSVDVVLHFASPASPPDYLKHPIETLKVGSLGTIHTLEIARQNNAKYLLASTSEVYGDPLEHPQSENYAGNVSTTGPRSVYDEAKRFAEAMVMAYHRQYDVDTRIVRIFNTYGPRIAALMMGVSYPTSLRNPFVVNTSPYTEMAPKHDVSNMLMI